MTTAFIALGSNLGESREILSGAVTALHALPKSRVNAFSPAYESPAIGPGEQPDYLNMVAALETALDAEELLTHLQAIETEYGRERGVRWAARTLDLDMLLFGDLQRSSQRLTIPHPRMAERDFVLQPLHDIAPALTLPCGRSLAALLSACTPRTARNPTRLLLDLSETADREPFVRHL